MRAWQPADPFGDPPSDEEDVRSPPHTLPMAYLPPNRLTVPLPQLPPYVSTSTRLQQQRHQKRAAAAAAASHQRQLPNSANVVVAPRNAKQIIGKQGVVVHEHQREATLDTPIAWFALNVPRQGGGDAVACVNVLRPRKDQDGVISIPPPFYTSRDVYHGATRGFVVPGPPQVPASRSQGSTVDAPPTVFGTYDSDETAGVHSRSFLLSMQSPRKPRHLTPSGSAMIRVPVEVLRRIFRFLPSADLDDRVVHVQRLWYFAVSGDRALTKRRFEFHPHEVAQLIHHRNNDNQALGNGNTESRGYCSAHNDARGILYYLATGHRRPPPNPSSKLSPNAALSLHPKISLMMIPSPVSLTALPSKVVMMPKSGNSVAVSPCDLSPISSFCATPFATPEIPFAWVGVEFLHGLQVNVSAYRFCASAPVPLAWEFQGCADTPENWSTGNWHVLHAVSSSTNPLLSTSFTASATRSQQSAAGDAAPSLLFLLPQHRWGPMKRFRLVQVERNAFWGHSFCVSALELYGSLTTVAGGAAASAIGATFLR